MYALCVAGAVNMQGFVWKFFLMHYIQIFIHSFIHMFFTGIHDCLLFFSANKTYHPTWHSIS